MDLLKRNPNFANLLKRIDSHQKILVQNHLQPRCVAAKKKCDASRLAYLKYLTLKQDIDSQTLLNEIKTEKVFCNAFSQLNQLAPIGISPVALPNHPESSQTIFGIEKKNLLEIPGTGKEDIITQVEASLKLRCAELKRFFSELAIDVWLYSAKETPSGVFQPASNSNDWLAESQLLHDSLLSLQSDYFSRLSNLIEITEKNISMALRWIRSQLEVVGPHAAACKSTYSPSRVHTLQSIREKLEADAERSYQDVERSQSILARYKAAGPEFERLAHAYHAMLAKIDVLNQDIERLKA
ncbi:hypothetical protein L0F63_005221 [Massospora cicadina]|nr:hypothetical protein L0F63_005221 [Massospora cicadina]